MISPGEDQTGGPYDDAWRARVAADLLAYIAEEQELWGGIDEMMLARYEAGVSPEAERIKIEQAMRDHPALRECMEIDRQITAEWQAIPATPVPVKHRARLPELGSLTTEPKPGILTRISAWRQKWFGAVASWVAARPALAVAVAAHAVVLGLFAAIYWPLGVDKLDQNQHKLAQSLQELNQQIAAWDAAHAAEAEAFELSSKLSMKLDELVRNAKTMPPEERQRKSQELVAEYQAFLAKYPDHRTLILDAFVKNPDFVLNTPPGGDQPGSIGKVVPLAPPPFQQLEKKFMSFRQNVRRLNRPERQRQAEALVAEYRALQEAFPGSHSYYIDLALTDPRFIAATKGGVIQASELKPVPDER